MPKLRIIQLVHETLVPPDDVSGLSPAQFAEIRTEYEVAEGLRAAGHEVHTLGLYDDLGVVRRAIDDVKPHVAFNLLEEFHGLRMFDQNVVSYLELKQVPYTGCNPRGLILARDKALSKKILHYHRLGVPGFMVCRRGRKFHRHKRLGFPLIVKSLVDEASRGISEASVVHNDEKLAERIAFIHESLGSDVIVEQYIDGREMYIGVLGNQRVEVFPPWELFLENLRPDAPRIATRAAKWDLDYQARHNVMIGPAEGLSDAFVARFARVARRIYRILELSGYARIDFRVTADERVYFLEANPNPDIHKDGEFASAAEQAGHAYPALLQKIVNLGRAHMRGLRRAEG